MLCFLSYIQATMSYEWYLLLLWGLLLLVIRVLFYELSYKSSNVQLCLFAILCAFHCVVVLTSLL